METAAGASPSRRSVQDVSSAAVGLRISCSRIDRSNETPGARHGGSPSTAQLGSGPTCKPSNAAAASGAVWRKTKPEAAAASGESRSRLSVQAGGGSECSNGGGAAAGGSVGSWAGTGDCGGGACAASCCTSSGSGTAAAPDLPPSHALLSPDSKGRAVAVAGASGESSCPKKQSTSLAGGGGAIGVAISGREGAA